MKEFDSFFRWKLNVEQTNAHILDDTHRKIAYVRLCPILSSWTAYRPKKSKDEWEPLLREALNNISDAYNQIRKFSLLEFTTIPTQPLKEIYHELGRVKEYLGQRSDYYYILAIGKPLMILWGQTLGFDSNVRANAPMVPTSNSWSFDTWHQVMTRLQKTLTQECEVVNEFNHEARTRYNSDSIVPYGRFLDIYWFR